VAKRAHKHVRSPEEKAAHSRPPNWTPRGPKPVGPPPDGGGGGGGGLDLAPAPGVETLSFLAGDFRIFQLIDGHRWSLDDHLVAAFALEEAWHLEAAVAPHAAPRPPIPLITDDGDGDDSSISSGSEAAEAAADTAAAHASGIQQRQQQQQQQQLHALDLGCGIGSVALMLAWGLAPHWRVVGVEAQDVSIGLARRSAAYNLGSAGVGPGRRLHLIHGDLRRPPADEFAPPPGGFQLITGTPPYVPLGAGGASGRPQKTPCNLEFRGGVEDYVEAGASLLSADGRMVLVMGVQGQPRGDRVEAAAESAGLAVARRIEVVPREGKPPLMAVYILRRMTHHEGGGGGGEDGGENAAPTAPRHQQQQHQHQQRFVVRNADQTLTREMHAAREMIGMPPARGSPWWVE
jgi:tRNA1(Val) A37 N6-methylase TrmN6